MLSRKTSGQWSLSEMKISYRFIIYLLQKVSLILIIHFWWKMSTVESNKWDHQTGLHCWECCCSVIIFSTSRGGSSWIFYGPLYFKVNEKNMFKTQLKTATEYWLESVVKTNTLWFSLLLYINATKISRFVSMLNKQQTWLLSYFTCPWNINQNFNSI